MAVSRILPAALLARFRHQVALIGVKNGVNAVFTTPEFFLEETLHVYWNGVRIFESSLMDYVASESGGLGTGFDTITFTAGKMPEVFDVLAADYVALA